MIDLGKSEMQEHAKEGELEREVAGEYNTFRVYLYMLRAKDGSVRQVQRALGFSSPRLAMHHLKKLQKFGLVVKNRYGTYHVVPKKFGILKFFVVARRWIVPRTAFVAIIFIVITIVFLAYLPSNKHLIWALVPSVIGLIVSIYQTVKFYHLLNRNV